MPKVLNKNKDGVPTNAVYMEQGCHRIGKTGSDKMSKNQEIKRALRRFEKAAIEKSWAGSSHPDERDEITAEYIQAKDNLQKLLNECVPPEYKQ